MRGEIIFTSVKSLIDFIVSPVINWARRNSQFPLHIGLMCCALEMGATMACRWDTERMGILPRASPRQCDLMIVNGPVNKKMAERIKLLYDQMPDPKWVIAMGECAISGGPFVDSYNVDGGVGEVIPVDVYIPGCPPHPEALVRGVQELQSIIRHGKEKRAAAILDYFKELKIIDQVKDQETEEEVSTNG
ncbi:MAG: NADH-quinone oxidoreductase subunit B [Promethearchaeota archaeon]